MRRGLVLSVAATALTVIALAVHPVAPAAAEPNCPAGHICTWSGSDFTGTMSDYGPDKFGQCHPGTFGSVQNATSDRPAHVYVDSTSCAGSPNTVKPGETSTVGGNSIHIP